MELNAPSNLLKKNEPKVNQMLSSLFSKIIDDNYVGSQGEDNLLKQLSNFNNDDLHIKDVKHSLKRLIRGLGSSKIELKKRFYTNLTAYFIATPDMQIDELINIAEIELKPSSNISKSEKADVFMGRILFCGSLMRSKQLTNFDTVQQQKIVEMLLNAGFQRSYLPFVSIFFLIDYIDELDEKYMEAIVWPILSKTLSISWSEHNLDTFYALIFVNKKFPSLMNEKFIKLHLGAKSIFDVDTMDNLLKLVTNLPRYNSCQHPVYKLFCEELTSTENTCEFWKKFDERFVKPSKSIEYLSVELINYIIPNIKDKSLLSSLLTSNFVSHMLKRFNISKNFRNDHIANSFRKALAQLIVALKDDEIKSKIRIEVLKKLIVYPGDLMIERITGVKVLQMIIESMDANGVEKVSKLYRKIIENKELKKFKNEEKSWSNAERIYVSQMMSKLLCHQAKSGDHQWRVEQLKFLFDIGFCEIESVEADLAGHFKDSFCSALNHKFTKLNDLCTVLRELINRLHTDLFEKKSCALRTSLNEPEIKIWQKMMNFISKIDDNKKTNKAMFIFYIMDLNMGLHLFFDSNLAIPSINEIHSCSEKVTEGKISKRKKKLNVKKRNDNEEEEDEPEWIDVIVDLLLSLLSKNSHLLRSLVRCVFPHMCSVLTTNSIHQILEVLDPQDEAGPLVPDDPENEPSSDSESSETSGESDDDENDRNVRKKVNNKKSDDDFEINAKDEDSEDETTNDRLRLAVRQALGDASAQTDDEDIDIDEIDEEEGKRLDESLAAAFRTIRDSKSSTKKYQSKSAEALTHFRTRVIDLLEIYLDSGPSMALALDMLVPLFALLEFCIKDPHQNPLKNRVRSCLKKLSNVRKFKDVENVDEKLLADLFKTLIEKGERSTSVYQGMADKLCECCVFLVRCAEHISAPSTTLVNILNENVISFFKKRDSIIPENLFKNILQLKWNGNWKLALLVLEFAFDNSIRSYRRAQALEFLITFYHNCRLIKDAQYFDVRRKIEEKLFHNSTALFKKFSNVNVKDNCNNDTNHGQEIDGNKSKEIPQKFLCLLWTLLNVIYPNHMEKVWDWNRIAEEMIEYRKRNSLSKDAKSAYNKLAVHISIMKFTQQSKKVIDKSPQEKLLNGDGFKIDAESRKKVVQIGAEGDKDGKNNIKIEKEKGDKNNKKLKKSRKKKLKKEANKKLNNNKDDEQKFKNTTQKFRQKAMSQCLEKVNSTGLTVKRDSIERAPLENGILTSSETRSNHKKRSNEIAVTARQKRKYIENLDLPYKFKKKKNI